jgi:hypothetical protein
MNRLSRPRASDGPPLRQINTNAITVSAKYSAGPKDQREADEGRRRDRQTKRRQRSGDERSDGGR